MTEPNRHPDFEALLHRVRSQPAPPTRVTYADVRGASARRTRWLAAAVGLAAVVVGTLAWTSMKSAAEEEAVPLAASDPAPRARSVEVVPNAESPASVDRISLDGGATLEPVEPGSSGEVTSGTFVVRTGEESLELPVRARVLEIAAASEVFVDNSVVETSFHVRAGSARWRPAAPSSKSKESAAVLATRAEKAMIAGEHAEAIRILRQLVRQHPSSAAAKGGLIDLARLEKKVGRSARAHCAYALFLERFPRDARAPSVRSADDAVGVSATECRGLRPVEK